MFSGLPSTVWMLATGGNLLTSTEAAGTMLAPRTSSRFTLVVAGAVAHLGLSFGWAQVLARVLPRRHAMATGVVAGAGIAALDLGVVGRRFPAVRRLPAAPQVLDHLAYGAIVGAVLRTPAGPGR